MPLIRRGLRKLEQIGALNDVRTAATRSHEWSFIAHKHITKQVQTSLAMVTSGGVLTFKMNVNSVSTLYEAFNNDVTPYYSINNEINLFVNDTTA